MAYDKYCEPGSPVCTVNIPFYPPFDSESAGCFWTRLEVDFPKFSAWTLDQSMISLRSPGNPSCTIASVSLSGRNIFELKAPTLDCFRADGCLCDVITPAAARTIRWRPVPSLLKHSVTRRVCRAARTYVYVRFQCTLSQPDANYTGYRVDPTTGDYEAPATISLSWTRSINDSDPLAPSLRALMPTTLSTKDVRAYCRHDTVSSPAAVNRFFLTLLVAISAIMALAVLAIAIVRCIIAAIAARARSPAAGAATADLPAAAPLEKDVAAEAGATGVAAAGNLAAAPTFKQPSMIEEVMRVDFHDGRDRAFTALLVAAVGLYIAGTLFEPAIQPQNAYERALSPSLRSATMGLTRHVTSGSYSGFVRRFGRLLLTIFLCSTLGALVFGALLYNLSARPWLPTTRASWVYRAKLAISITSMAVLDVAMLLYIISNYSMAKRWTQPVAYHFLSIITLLLYLAAHVLFIRLMVRRPQPMRSRRLSEIRKDLNLAKALRALHETPAPGSDPPNPSAPSATHDTNPLIDRTHPPSAPSTPIHPRPHTPTQPDPHTPTQPGPYTPGTPQASAAIPQAPALPYSFTTHLQATLPPSDPIHDPTAAVLADLAISPNDPEVGLTKPSTTDPVPEPSAPSLVQRLRSLVAPAPGAPGVGERLRVWTQHVRGLLQEEGKSFRYSPWFVAPLIISLVLLLFFFIRSLYVIASVRDCLGPSGCPSWTGFNAAVVPLITTLFNAFLHRDSMDLLGVLANARVRGPAQGLLLSMTSSFSARELAKRTVADNIAGLSVPDKVWLNGYGVFRDMTTQPPIVVVYNPNTRSYSDDTAVTTTPVVVFGFKFYIGKSGGLMVGNQTWAQFYLDSDTFQQQDYNSLFECNKTSTANYIANLADQSYQEYPYRQQLDLVAHSLGTTGPALAQQFIITTSRPVLVELCNTTDVLPNITTSNPAAQAILDSIVSNTFQSQGGSTAAAAAGSNATVARAVQQLKKLQQSNNRSTKFFRDLKSAFGAGAYMGAVAALGVSLVSLVVIVGVYKKAVLRLRRQLAISAVFSGHPEGRKLLQGTTLAQKKLIIEAYGLDTANDSSAAVTLRMFTMLELLNSQKMTLVIFFYGIVFSTVLLQLIMCTIIFGFILTAIFHPAFWAHAFPVVASWVLALLLSQLVVMVVISGTIGARIAPNDTIGNMSSWLAYFIVFSFAYIVLGVLLAGVRLVLILLSAIIMSCRIDVCLNMLSKVLDPAYSAFLSMMKMQVEMKRYSDEELVGPALDEGHRNALLVQGR